MATAAQLAAQKPIKKAVITAKELSPAKPAAKKIIPPPIKPLTTSEVQSLIEAKIAQLIASGTIATPSTAAPLTPAQYLNLNNSFDSSKAVGMQPIFVSAFGNPGDGTSYLSADNFTANSVTGGNTSAGTLTVSSQATVAGGLELTTPTTGNIIDTDSGAYLSPGGTWTNASSKDLKENFTAVDPTDTLQKIDALSITRWNYKKESSSTTHIGPLAEDFYAAFGVGDSKSISTIDPAGIALLGIQALSKQVSDPNWFSSSLSDLGITMKDGITAIGTLVVHMIQTAGLTIGSSTQPTGITLYDQTTRQPACVVVNNGVLIAAAGECGTTGSASTAPIQTVPANTDDATATTSDLSGTSSSTADVTTSSSSTVPTIPPDATIATTSTLETTPTSTDQTDIAGPLPLGPTSTEATSTTN